MFNQTRLAKRVTAAVNKIDPHNDVASSDQVRDISFTIKQRINRLAAKDEVLKLLEENKYIIVHNKKLEIPSFMSAMETGSGKILVDVSSHASSLDTVIPAKIFGLLQNGLITHKLNTKGQTYINNAAIMRDSAFIYARMINKIFDKTYGSNMDDFRRDLLLFVFAKFFLIKMTGRVYNEEAVEQIAYKSTTQSSTENMIRQFEQDILTKDSYVSIFKLIEDLTTYEPFSSFKVRTLVEQFVRMYGEGALLSLDYLPAFYQTIFGVRSSSFLVKDSVINNMISENVLARLYLNFFTLK